MAFINSVPPGATPAARVVALARELGNAGADFFAGNALSLTADHLFRLASRLMCWDAALLCAWAAKGIDCNLNPLANGFDVVTAADYSRIFGQNPWANPANVAADVNQLRAMPLGCFVGFVGGPNGDGVRVLRHCMIHTGNGIGAGNKSDCVLRAAHSVGFELVDMAPFFGADNDLNENATTTVIFVPITGQVI
jgi:hypothetical protein